MSEKKYIIDNPSLMAEWHFEKNNQSGFHPQALTLGSNKKVWWKCKQEHTWEAKILNRAHGRGCPYCSNKKVLQGTNDLLTLHPLLAKEWNYPLNKDLKPENITAHSKRKVWWACSEKHEWIAAIDSRARGAKCPYCLGRYPIKGKTDLQTVNPILANEWNHDKNNKLTPFDVLPNSNKKVWWRCNKEHEWQAAICDRNRGRGCPICNSERRTSFPEYALLYYLQQCGLEVIHSYKGFGYELDIYIPSKKVAIEYDGYFWHKNKMQQDLKKNSKCKNDGITLYRVREDLSSLNDSSIDYSLKKNQQDLPQVIQKVLYGITQIIIDINLKRDSIAIENLRTYIEKEESLLFHNPKIAKEWNYEKNRHLKPEHFTVSSGKKVWWKCNIGHEWTASISNRNKGTGCPICSNKKVLQGYNDLVTVNLLLAKEWNYAKNGDLRPEQFTTGANRKVWWRCYNGHEWQASINSRNTGIGCPHCSGRYAIKNETDLLALNPSLAEEWDYDLNKDLTPFNVKPNSHKMIWWKCKKGHTWQALISNRNKGIGCPHCSGRYAIEGETDLQTVNPTLTEEWNYEKNGNLQPTQFTANSGQKVWWKCNRGHQWQAKIAHRNKGIGCPICSNRQIISGVNDLSTANPHLSQEWNYTLNINLTPEQVSPHSGKKVWWKCKNGHEWQATVANRSNGTGCPHCAKLKKQ